MDICITNPENLLTEKTQLTKNHLKERMRGVYLGTKKVEGSKGLATHWAIGLGDGVKLLWMEVDGNGGGHSKKSIVCKNTINSHDKSSWRLERSPTVDVSRRGCPVGGSEVDGQNKLNLKQYSMYLIICVLLRV